MKNTHHASPSHHKAPAAKKPAKAKDAKTKDNTDPSQLDADARHLAQQEPRPSRRREEPAEDLADTAKDSVEADEASDTDSEVENDDSTHELPVAKGRRAQRSSSPSPSAGKRQSSDS